MAQAYAPSTVHPHNPCVDAAQISVWSQPHLSHWSKKNC